MLVRAQHNLLITSGPLTLPRNRGSSALPDQAPLFICLSAMALGSGGKLFSLRQGNALCRYYAVL